MDMNNLCLTKCFLFEWLLTKYCFIWLCLICFIVVIIKFFCTWCFFGFFWRDEDGVQVFSLSDQQLVVLEITITNKPSDPHQPEDDGDDAHVAQLLISLPNTLSYSGSRVPATVRPELPLYRWWCLNELRSNSICVIFWLTADEMSSKPERLSGRMWPGKPRQTWHEGNTCLNWG